MPRLKLQIEGGRVVKVEGGGFQGALMNDIMKKYENVPIPFMPHPGWLYIHHYSLPPGGGASMWGFGVEADIPEMEEFMAQHGIPNTHDFHMDMRFPTYEATVTGGKKILVVDKGHSTLLDDPEIRAIASKYGDPDQVLREEGAIPVPGINAPGDYREYAKDPPKYWLRMREEVRSGKSPYLVTIVPWQLQGIGKPEATGGELASNQSE
jgi:hypothetical protein